MKYLIFLILCNSTIQANELVVNDVIKYFDGEIQTLKKSAIRNALIKSESDLSFYLQINNVEFPLNYLKGKDKIMFLDSLQFNEKGLTSYHYEPLLKLPKDQTYEILSLFGFGSSSDTIHDNQSSKACWIDGVNDTTKCDDGGGGGDHKGYWCSSRATCTKDLGSICTSNC